MYQQSPVGLILPSSPRNGNMFRATSLVSSISLASWLGSHATSKKAEEDDVNGPVAEKPFDAGMPAASTSGSFCFNCPTERAMAPSPVSEEVSTADQASKQEQSCDENGSEAVPITNIQTSCTAADGTFADLACGQVMQLQLLLTLANSHPLGLAGLLKANACQVQEQKFWELQAALRKQYLRSIVMGITAGTRLKHKPLAKPIMQVVTDMAKFVPLLKLEKDSAEGQQLLINETLLQQLQRVSEFLPHLIEKFNAAVKIYKVKHAQTGPPITSDLLRSGSDDSDNTSTKSGGSATDKLSEILSKSSTDTSLDMLLTAYLRVTGAVRAVSLLKKFDKHFPAPKQRELVRKIIKQRCKLHEKDGEKYLVLNKSSQ